MYPDGHPEDTRRAAGARRRYLAEWTSRPADRSGPTGNQGAVLPKHPYNREKREKELKRQRKREEKEQRRLARAAARADNAAEPDAPDLPAPDWVSGGQLGTRPYDERVTTLTALVVRAF